MTVRTRRKRHIIVACFIILELLLRHKLALFALWSFQTRFTTHSCLPIPIHSLLSGNSLSSFHCDSVIARAISRVNLQGGIYKNWTVFGQFLVFLVPHFSLPSCPSGWRAGGWSLKVKSDAVFMSHAGQPHTVIPPFLEWSNQNQDWTV